MTLSRRTRLIKLAKARGDLLALAVLEGNRTFRDEPDYRIFTGIVRLRRIA